MTAADRLFVAALLALLAAAYARPALAGETAAVALEPLKLPASPDHAGSGDVLLRLVENVPPEAMESDAGDDTILAAIPFSAPDDVEDAIARDFKLEIAGRLVLKSLGWRIVRFRVPDLRPIDGVIAGLRADKRVSEAQVNVRYQAMPLPKAPEIEVGSVKLPAEAKDREKAGRPAAGARKSGERREAADRVRRGPTRSAKVAVGDVLSGGF